MRAINRIRETRRKKKVKMTFKSSSKRGCSYGDSISQTNLQDTGSHNDNKSSDHSVSSCGQTGYMMTKNGRFLEMFHSYLLL